jgi:chemotaxis protein methyltransferase CheR
MNLDALLNFIHAHLGLNAGHYGQEAWRELLLKRIATVGDHSPEAYLIRLQTDERELHTLTSLITINETYFYREPQHLRLLTEQLCPELLAQRTAAGRPVRILSVGCSTGEEPYSILMALRERYGELAEQLFEINAGDVDREVLDRARAGVYGRFSFRALSQTLQDRYFTPCDANQFQIDARLRQQVQFQPFNLLAPDYPAQLVGQDVIFFRNVSIYFDAPTRQRVQEQLKTLLVPGGYLFVGIAETLANDFGVLTLRERQGVFLFVNAPPAVTQPLFGMAPADQVRDALPKPARRPTGSRIRAGAPKTIDTHPTASVRARPERRCRRADTGAGQDIPATGSRDARRSGGGRYP